jgi:hypothetical protein
MEPRETVPVRALAPQDINPLVEAWRADHRIERPLLQRRAQRAGAAKYRPGLRLDRPRQAIEPLVLALEGANPTAGRALPRGIREGAWPDEALLERHGPEVAQEVGDEQGVRPLDGRDVLKQGQESVGVPRQDCGDGGQRAHGPAGVYVGSASHTGSRLLDRRRYWPQEWVAAEASAARRRRGGGPAGIPCTPQAALGGAMLPAVHRAGTVRGRGGTCDAALGRDTAGLEQVAGRGRWYLAEGPHDTQV